MRVYIHHRLGRGMLICLCNITINRKPAELISHVGGGPVMQVELHWVNHQCPITWLRYNHSLYPTFVNTHCIYMPYFFYNNCRLKELKDELEKEIKSMHSHKERNYATEHSCVSAPSSDPAGSQLLWISRSQYLLSFWLCMYCCCCCCCCLGLSLTRMTSTLAWRRFTGYFTIHSTGTWSMAVDMSRSTNTRWVSNWPHQLPGVSSEFMLVMSF